LYCIESKFVVKVAAQNMGFDLGFGNLNLVFSATTLQQEKLLCQKNRKCNISKG
jgi:hypothetical protein